MMVSLNPIIGKKVQIFIGTSKNQIERVIAIDNQLFEVEFNEVVPITYQNNSAEKIDYGLWCYPEKIKTNKKNKNKNKNKYKTGERIIILDEKFKGEMGTIILIDNDSLPYAVELDEYNENAHNCDGHTEFGYGYWFGENDLRMTND